MVTATIYIYTHTHICTYPLVIVVPWRWGERCWPWQCPSSTLNETAKARLGAEVWPEPSQYPFVTLESGKCRFTPPLPFSGI